MDLSKFKSKTKIQIRYADLDTYGHVNNKNFLSFLEEARISYIKDIGLDKEVTIFDFGSVVGRIDIKYLYPVQFGDDVRVYTRCTRLGNKSYDLENIIVVHKNDKEIISAVATVTMVSFDMKTGKTKPVNIEMIKAVEKFEIEKPLKQSNI